MRLRTAMAMSRGRLCRSSPSAVVTPYASVAPSVEAILCIAFLGVLGTGFATLLYFRLIRTLGPTVFSQANFMNKLQRLRNRLS